MPYTNTEEMFVAHLRLVRMSATYNLALTRSWKHNNVLMTGNPTFSSTANYMLYDFAINVIDMTWVFIGDVIFDENGDEHIVTEGFDFSKHTWSIVLEILHIPTIRMEQFIAKTRNLIPANKKAKFQEAEDLLWK